MERRFDTIGRLVATYERGMLVPFLGAGISVPHCALWAPFVANLEQQAGITAGTSPESSGAMTSSTSSLIQRAGRAVRKLRLDRMPPLDDAIRAALRAAPCPDWPEWPPGAHALAQIWWPLVITTNYDDWFYAAWNRKFVNTDQHRQPLERMEICGRGAADCERVLNGLRAPDNPLLWAIQGFVGGLAPKHPSLPELPAWKRCELGDQLVVGHAEYRREAVRSLGFRRAFSEVFRSRSLLFVGSGLSESYFDGLFDEVLELQGTLPHMHYALIQRGSADPRFLRDRFQIEAIEYEQHPDVPKWLHHLRREIGRRPTRTTSWGAHVGGLGKADAAGPDLRVVRRKLPAPQKHECLVISAGLGAKEEPLFSGTGLETVAGYFPDFSADRRTLVWPEPMVWRFDGIPVFAAVARDAEHHGRDARDARIVADAMRAVLSAAKTAGFARMHAMLLAAGTRRVFAPYVSLIEMIRGFATWKRDEGDEAFRLTIDVVDPGSIHLLASGRLNLTEILTVEEVRFWVEIWRSPLEIARYLRFANCDVPVAEVLRDYDLPANGWRVDIVPSPVKHATSLEVSEILARPGVPVTLAGVGIRTGSTLRIVPPELGS